MLPWGPTALHRKTGVGAFLLVLLTGAPEQKQPMWPAADEGGGKMWSRRPPEYYSAIIRNEKLTPGTTRVNLKNVTPSEKARHTGNIYWPERSSLLRQKADWCCLGLHDGGMRDDC